MFWKPGEYTLRFVDNLSEPPVWVKEKEGKTTYYFNLAVFRVVPTLESGRYVTRIKWKNGEFFQ